MKIVPITFKAACEFIALHHRHNKPPTGMKFAIAVSDESGIRGVLTAGRPVARCLDDGLTIEINRTCTDGCPNANSMLYGAAWRVSREMGYMRAITYIQADETGSSLRASGWIKSKELDARKSWAESSKSSQVKRDPVGNGGVARQRWEITRKEESRQSNLVV